MGQHHVVGIDAVTFIRSGLQDSDLQTPKPYKPYKPEKPEKPEKTRKTL